MYYIIRKKGNENYNYFRISKYKKCPIHKSFKCGCKLNSDEKCISKIIDNYILVYRRCSFIFDITNGKIKFNTINIYGKNKMKSDNHLM